MATTLTFEIQVTDADIREGRRGECSFCPIALAGDRAIGTNCRVGFKHIFTETHVGDLTPEAQQFVRDFDLGGQVVPFSFTVEMRRYATAPEAK